MMTLPETWSRKDKVNWVATRMTVAENAVRAWEEKKGLNAFEALADAEPLPKELTDLEKEISEYPADIRSAARELNKYFSEVKIEANAKSLDSLRVLLDGEHIFYELTGKDLEEAHEALWAEARRAE